MMRLKGAVVNQTLDSRLERESHWQNTHYKIVKCQQIFQTNIEHDNFFVPTSEEIFDVLYSRKIEIPKAKKQFNIR